MLATLSFACLTFLVLKEELLTKEFTGLQIKNPVQRHTLPDLTERKSMTDTPVKNPGEGQPLKGPQVVFFFCFVLFCFFFFCFWGAPTAYGGSQAKG